MTTARQTLPAVELRRLRGGLPLVILPLLVGRISAEWPAWVQMWGLAGALYAGLKWLTYADSAAAKQASPRRIWAYLLLWPGMHADAFLPNSRTVLPPEKREWIAASMKCGAGVVVLLAAGRWANSGHPLLVAWAGVVGIVTLLHFGLLHLLSVYWRRAGVVAPPIMDAPLRSTALSEFWGRRWNRAYRDLSHRYVFSPLERRIGVAGAAYAGFIVSGIVHDLVISVPAGAGYGLPTLYFCIQGAGVLLERSTLGRRMGLRRSVVGRGFTAAVLILPLPLLCHSAFLERVILPMLMTLGARQ